MVVKFNLNFECVRLSQVALLACVATLAGCKSIATTPAITVDSGQRWAMLPIENLSTTPLAGEKAATLVETQLRRRGVVTLQSYPETEPVTLSALLNGGAQQQQAKLWAQNEGYRYAVAGTVSEWHYKTGTDKEPAVGLSLKLIDLPTGQVLWQAAGSRTGWGYSNLSRISNKVVDDLVSELNIRRQTMAVAQHQTEQSTQQFAQESIAEIPSELPQSNATEMVMVPASLQTGSPIIILPDAPVTDSALSEMAGVIAQPAEAELTIGSDVATSSEPVISPEFIEPEITDEYVDAVTAEAVIVIQADESVVPLAPVTPVTPVVETPVQTQFLQTPASSELSGRRNPWEIPVGESVEVDLLQPVGQRSYSAGIPEHNSSASEAVLYSPDLVD